MKTSSTVILTAAAGLAGFALAIALATGKSSVAGKDSESNKSASEEPVIMRDPGTEALNRIGTVLATHADLAAIASLPKLLDSLDNAALGQLLESVDGQSLEQRFLWLPRIMAYWTRRDRAAATRWMEPRLEHLNRKSLFDMVAFVKDADTAMLKAWADNAQHEAVDAARRHKGGRLEEVLIGYALSAEPVHASSEVFKVLQEFTPGNARRMAMGQLFDGWAQNDPAGALGAAASLPPGLERDTSVSTALRWLAGKGPAEALRQSETLGITDPKLLAATFARATEANPVIAAQWLERQDPSLARLQTILMSSWAGRDPAAAFTWAQERGLYLTETSFRLLQDMARETLPGTSEIRGVSAIQAALASKPEEALRWINENMPGERDFFLQMASGPTLEKLRLQFSDLSLESATRLAPTLVADLMRRDSQQAQAWAAALPPGPAREQAWSTLGAYRSEPIPLPSGADRDAMLSGMATHWATSGPAKSLDWAAEIGDENVRHRVMDDVFWLLQRGPQSMGMGTASQGVSPKALADAAAWVERAAVPEAWKRNWR